jgi:hypothetical protein
MVLHVGVHRWVGSLHIRKYQPFTYKFCTYKKTVCETQQQLRPSIKITINALLRKDTLKIGVHFSSECFILKVRSSRKLGIQLKTLNAKDKSLFYKHASLQGFTSNSEFLGADTKEGDQSNRCYNFHDQVK